MATRPTISIGLPVFNGENYLAVALNSLQEQTYEDFEIIVSDNASTDGTEEIARGLAARDRRIRYVRNAKNLGANRNYNRTFALALGPYFRWHAHDDVCGPKYLELCLGVLENDPSVVLAHTRTDYVDRNGDPLIRVTGGFLDPDGYIERLVTDDHAPAMLSSARPHVRLDAIVNRMSVFFDVFGLVRSADMRRTMALQNYYGADKVFLAELALLGKIVRLDTGGFDRRCHNEASTRARSYKDLATWSDSTRSFDFYPALIMRGYFNAVWSSDLPTRERAHCLAVVAKRFRSPYRLIRGR